MKQNSRPIYYRPVSFKRENRSGLKTSRLWKRTEMAVEKVKKGKI
jgi:hypothetical protein